MTDRTALKPRRTTYQGIEMRSRLEAGFAQWLDSIVCRWQYEPQAFAGPDGQYLPDFLLERMQPPWAANEDELRRAYVEIKPSINEVTEPLLKRMKVILESDGAALLLIAIPAATLLFHPGAPRALEPVVWVRGEFGCPAIAWAVQQPWLGNWWEGN